MAIIIDGKKLAQEIIERIKARTQEITEQRQIRPGLAVILVGQDPASQVYVKAKSKKAKECCFYSRQHNLAETVSEEELLELIKELNNDAHIHGILVQLPLPKHINKSKIMQAIHPSKDVDGFNYYNIGKLASGDLQHSLIPCTPLGIMVMLKHYLPRELSGLDAVIVGRSNIVGKPMAQLLLQANTTVTIAHSHTRELAEVCRSADILIAAAGQPHLIKGDWIKPGAAAIDVGINRVFNKDSSATKEAGKPVGKEQASYRLIGDIDFASAQHIAGYITPVPGGVGPMTIAMLMANSLNAACYRADLAPLEL